MMAYSPILATLGYVLSPDHSMVLMVHRNARPGDPHLGKYNGLGGKLEAHEDVVTGMRRELREEAHIEALAMHLRGTVSWPGFGKHGEDWFGFIFTITSFSGVPPMTNHEGALEWVSLDRIHTLPLWPGDRYFLPLVFGPNPHQFHGVMPYQNGEPVSWTYNYV